MTDLGSPGLGPSETPGEADEQRLSKVLLSELRSQSQSDRDVFGQLQDEIHRIARAKMRFERADHTLQPTALVNEAFVKLFKSHSAPNLHVDLSNSLRIVAHAMEQVLNDYADAHNAAKRGGGRQQRVPLDDQQAREFAEGQPFARIDPALLIDPEQSEDILAIRDAIRLLGEISPRQAEVVRLRYYTGLTQEELAAVLDLSVETIKLDLRKAKAFLKVYIETKT